MSNYQTAHTYLNTDGLTPRSARFQEVQLDPNARHDQLDFHPEPQSVPLLPPRDDDKGKQSSATHTRYPFLIQILRRIPLALGIVVSILLFILVVISSSKPQALLEVVLQDEAPLLSSETISTPFRIDYSDYETFPLKPSEYVSECWKVLQAHPKHYGYWTAPPMGILDIEHTNDTSATRHRCTSTITYQLDDSVGLTAHLAFIAQLAVMANERNRTFFIDDSLWNRGRWTDHFEELKHTIPGPEPNCFPPPANEYVACPRLARHWIVNSHTAKFHFGHDFDDHYQDAYAMSVERSRPVLEQGARSLKDIIIPSKINARLIEMARGEMGGRRYIGVHIRRGDRKPMSWKFNRKPIPINVFLESLRKTAARLDPSLGAAWIATDSVAAIDELTWQDSSYDFYSLSRSSFPELRSSVPTSEYNQSTWNDLPIERRVMETRGMVVDLAMLSGAWNADPEGTVLPEASVCSLSSTVCRLAAIFLGWKRAFDEKRWVEIDNAGSFEPFWTGYELF